MSEGLAGMHMFDSVYINHGPINQANPNLPFIQDNIVSAAIMACIGDMRLCKDCSADWQSEYAHIVDGLTGCVRGV